MTDAEIESMCAAWAQRQWGLRWPDEVPPHLRSDWREAMQSVREALDRRRAKAAPSSGNASPAGRSTR